MATFNGAEFVEEQLSSFASQTHADLELIVSDDCSSDNTLSIVENFSRTAKFPVIIQRNKTRLGYGGNFLSGSKLATGQYIAFSDQDDKWHPEKLAVALETISRTEADLFVHTAILTNVNGDKIGRFAQGIQKSCTYQALQLRPWGVFYGCCMVFPRRLLSLVHSDLRGPHTFEFSGQLSHDLWVYFLATSLGKVAVDCRPLISYRQHHSNQTPHVQASWLRTWWVSLGVAAHPSLPRGEIADHRRRLMQDLSTSSADPRLSQAALNAARYWQKIASHESSRLEFYSRTRLLSRALGWGTLAYRGGYKPFREAGLGWRLAIKDFALGVLNARRLKRSD